MNFFFMFFVLSLEGRLLSDVVDAVVDEKDRESCWKGDRRRLVRPLDNDDNVDTTFGRRMMGGRKAVVVVVLCSSSRDPTK